MSASDHDSANTQYVVPPRQELGWFKALGTLVLGAGFLFAVLHFAGVIGGLSKDASCGDFLKASQEDQAKVTAELFEDAWLKADGGVRSVAGEANALQNALYTCPDHKSASLREVVQADSPGDDGTNDVGSGIPTSEPSTIAAEPSDSWDESRYIRDGRSLRSYLREIVDAENEWAADHGGNYTLDVSTKCKQRHETHDICTDAGLAIRNTEVNYYLSAEGKKVDSPQDQGYCLIFLEGAAPRIEYNSVTQELGPRACIKTSGHYPF